eukprot:1457596-Pleurochrysis_carterae.AAC.1
MTAAAAAAASPTAARTAPAATAAASPAAATTAVPAAHEQRPARGRNAPHLDCDRVLNRARLRVAPSGVSQQPLAARAHAHIERAIICALKHEQQPLGGSRAHRCGHHQHRPRLQVGHDRHQLLQQGQERGGRLLARAHERKQLEPKLEPALRCTKRGVGLALARA